jgi:Ca-activated chloride channel family protein
MRSGGAGFAGAGAGAMSFGHPVLLLVLLALPVLAAVYLYLERRPPRYAMTFTNVDLLIAVSRGRQVRRYVPPALALLAVAGLCVALARPHRSTLVPSNDATVVLVVDVSGSMQAKDVKPTRLGAAQAAVRKFLKRVPPQIKLALVAFAGEAQVAAPPTRDRSLIREGLDSLDYFGGFGGTAIGDALAAAVELVKPPPPSGVQTVAYTVAAVSPRKKSPVTILFLSDGHQTRGLLQPLEGAARAREAGIPVFTIALGTPNGVLDRGAFPGGPFGPGPPGFGFDRRIPVPPDPVTLRAIARTTGGKFFEARSAKAVSAAYENLGSVVGREPGKREVTWWFVALAAILLVVAGVFSAFVAPRLP